MSNPFVHVELMSTDVDKAKSFYGGLFDWKLEEAAPQALGWTARQQHFVASQQGDGRI